MQPAEGEIRRGLVESLAQNPQSGVEVSPQTLEELWFGDPREDALVDAFTTSLLNNQPMPSGTNFIHLVNEVASDGSFGFLENTPDTTPFQEALETSPRPLLFGGDTRLKAIKREIKKYEGMCPPP